MSPFTIQTLFLLYSALSFFGAVLIAALFWKRRDQSANLWMYGCLCTAIATVVTVHRGDIPLVFSYSLMISFELSSLLLFSASLKQLSPLNSDRNVNPFIWATPAVIFVLLELERATSGGGLTPLMTAVSSLAFGVANVLCFYQTRQIGKRFTSSLFFNFIAFIFAAMAALYLLRVMNALGGYSGFAFDLKPYNLVIWFFLVMLGSIRNLTYIVLRLHLGFTEHGRLNNMNLRLSNILDERNEMILSLQKMNKLASINALASTIVHEINQPLTASKLNAQFTEFQLNTDQADIPLLKEVNKNIISDIDRASEIVRNLSKLALNQGNEVSTVNVCDTVNEIVEISNSRLLASGIKCEVHCDPIHQVQINLGEWRQVLLNIVNNAIDALADFSSDEKRIRISIVRKDKTIHISIQDNGPGLEKGKETEIFELLVSGKQGGTGIGLWISKNIINRGGGVISAMNVRGGGARFIIELPAVA